MSSTKNFVLLSGEEDFWSWRIDCVIRKDGSISNRGSIVKRTHQNKKQILNHHEKYAEIHGADHIEPLTRSGHRGLHLGLRREGKCKIPIEILGEIATKAYRRTEKGKQVQKKGSAKYERSLKGILKRKKRQKRKQKNNYILRETVATNIRLRTKISESYKGVFVNTYFEAGNHTNLYVIDEER